LALPVERFRAAAFLLLRVPAENLVHLWWRDLCWVRYLLAKLEDIAIVIADGELAHSIEKILNGINDAGFVFDLVPQLVNIIGIEID